MATKKRKGKNKYKPGSQWTKRQKTINSAQACNAGILFTCDTHRMREGKREAFNLLHQAAEHLDELTSDTKANSTLLSDDSGDRGNSNHGDNGNNSDNGDNAASIAPAADATAANDDDDDDDDANDGLDLAAEIAALKHPPTSSSSSSSTATSRFNNLTTNVKGLFVLVLTPDERHSPIDYVSQFCASARETGHLNSRFLTRVYPMETICRAREKDLAPTLAPLLDAYLEQRMSAGTPLPCSFAIDYKGRYMGKGFRNVAITALADTVAERHKIWSAKCTHTKQENVLKVDLTAPEFVIVCQAFSPLCGISVVDGDEFRKCGKYNLTKLEGVTGGEGAEAKTEGREGANEGDGDGGKADEGHEEC